jgi:hypothetical protein
VQVEKLVKTLQESEEKVKLEELFTMLEEIEKAVKLPDPMDITEYAKQKAFVEHCSEKLESDFKHLDQSALFLHVFLLVLICRLEKCNERSNAEA